MKQTHYTKQFLFISALLLGAILSSSCERDVKEWRVDSEFLVMSEFVAQNSEFSMFNELLEETKLYRELSTRGPFTLFLPTNEAMESFYSAHGMNSYQDFSDENAMVNFVFNHLIANEISSGDVGLGALRDTNALGDFIVTEFVGADIRLNKESIIINRDIKVANGYVHTVDQVVPIIEKSIYDVLVEQPSYSLFTKGLEITGLKDTLQIISYNYGMNKTARTRFTVLAVADTIFNRYGINNIDEFVAYFTSARDSVTHIDNPFYRYMEYHCLSNTYYLSDLETQLYPILSHDNNIKATITDDYKLNMDLTTEEYTGFNIAESNYPAKNGAIHSIDDLLLVETPSPTRIVFEVTNFEELTRGDYFGKYYMKWSEGLTTFENIKWEGDYLQYYFKDHDTGPLLNDDCLNMLGYWWIEITTPKIMKGKYKVSGNIWQNQVGYEVFVDGEKIGIVSATDVPDLGTFEWEKTEKHKIKLVAIEYGALFWDTITFTPVD